MNGMINTNTESNERGLLPYPIILAANKGEPETMKVVVLHYGSYMTSLSMRKLRDEQGNTYWGIDEDTRERLRAKLMQSVLAFKI
ncbi:helix-turn-helix domain-containing protein [Oceanobacillus sp. FSL K6-2867]|uniref:helix-turn-helix domain-containing protein n=1 Tax=Oceanobacillus sp. FSL K6-2867 TaxID=2954748 RepID=UPI0030D99C71